MGFFGLGTVDLSREPDDVHPAVDTLRVYAGYAGWAPGQLEQERTQNSWLTVGADLDLVFELAPEQRLPAAMELLGIDLARLSDEVGHA